MTGLRQANGHAAPVVDGVDERLVAYAFAVEAIFAELRAIIGQLSGTFILLQTRRTYDLGELPALVRDGAAVLWRESTVSIRPRAGLPIVASWHRPWTTSMRRWSHCAACATTAATNGS